MTNLTLDDKLYVAMDSECTVIYGAVEATSEYRAAVLLVSEPEVVMFDGGLPEEFSAILAQDLTDGTWREMAPLGAQPHGDCGGGIQVSDSYSRRFVQALPSGLWAVLTLAWYAINEGVEEVSWCTPGESIQRQAEYLICDDLRDLNYVVWTDYRYERIDGFNPDEAGALAAGQALTVSDIEWDGKAF